MTAILVPQFLAAEAVHFMATVARPEPEVHGPREAHRHLEVEAIVKAQSPKSRAAKAKTAKRK